MSEDGENTAIPVDDQVSPNTSEDNQENPNTSQGNPTTTVDNPNDIGSRFGKDGIWNILVEIVAWVGGIAGSFLLPPPVGPAETTKLNEGLAQYLLAVLAGIVIVFALVKNKKHHWPYWLIPAALALILAVTGTFLYSSYWGKWVCLYSHEDPPRPVVIGEHETDQAKRTRQDARCKDVSNCNAILYCFGGKEYKIWNSDEIDQRRLILKGLYFSILPFVLISLMCVIQSIYCAKKPDEENLLEQRREGRRPFFSGRWLSNNGIRKEILDLQFSENSVAGNMEVYQIDSNVEPHIETLIFIRALENTQFEGATLFFEIPDRRNGRIRYRMSLSTNSNYNPNEVPNEASLDTIDELPNRHWRLSRVLDSE